jgi:hypothetical protein
MNFRDQFTVYFIKPVGLNGPVKIGLSSNPTRRLAEFGAWSPIPLEIIGTIPGTWADEQYLHECFADDHLHGEWFCYSDALAVAIKKILADGNLRHARENLKPLLNLRSKKNRATRSAQSENAA